MSEEASKVDSKPSEDKVPQIAGTQFLRTLQLPPTLCTRSNSIQSMVTVNGGDNIWACCNEGSIVVWDTKTGQVLGTRQAHKATIFDIICVSNTHNPFAAEKNSIWAACMDATVTIWNTSLCLLRKIALGSSSATALTTVGHDVYVADAKHVYIFDSQTYSLRSTVDLPRLDFLTTLPSPTSSSTDSTTSESKSSLLRSVSSYANLYRHASSSPALVPLRPPSPEEDATSFSGYFVRSITQVKQHAWISTDGFVCFLDSATRSFVPGVYIDIPKINSTAYIQSTNQVWGACSDGCIYIWDADSPTKTGKIEPLQRLSGWTNDRVSKVINYEDKLIYCATWDKKMRVWDAQTAELLFTSSRPHECPIMAIIVLPYPWFKIYPQTSKSTSNLQLASSTTAVTPATSKENELVRRAAQSLPVQNLNTSSAEVAAKSPSLDSSTTISPNQPQEMTIMTVFTADWSSVSQWL